MQEIIKLLKRLLRLFQNYQDRDQTNTDWKPEPVDIDANTDHPIDVRPMNNSFDIKGVLFFPGHTEERYGTRTYNKIKEQHSNKLTIEVLTQKWLKDNQLKSIPFKSALRPNKYKDRYGRYTNYARKIVAKMARDINCEEKNILVVELHYNAASSKEAHGGYFMVNKSSRRSGRAAKILIDSFIANTPMTYRKSFHGMRGVRGVNSGNGSGWVLDCSDNGAMALLFEPFFCSAKTVETEWLFGAEEMSRRERDTQMEIIADKMSDLWIIAMKDLLGS